MTDMQAYIREYIISAPEHIESGKMIMSVIITSADIMRPDELCGKVCGEIGGEVYGEICSGINIVSVNAEFERDICRTINSIITSDSISVIAIDVSRFPDILIIADQHDVLGYDNIDPQFTRDINNFVATCYGKRTQTIIIANTNIPFTTLKMADY